MITPTSFPLPRSMRNCRRNLHDDPLAASSRLVSCGTAEWSRDNIDACPDWCVAASSRAQSLPESASFSLLLYSICSDLAHPARSLINRCELSIKINVRRWSEPKKNKAEKADRQRRLWKNWWLCRGSVCGSVWGSVDDRLLICDLSELTLLGTCCDLATGDNWQLWHWWLNCKCNSNSNCCRQLLLLSTLLSSLSLQEFL